MKPFGAVANRFGQSTSKESDIPFFDDFATGISGYPASSLALTVGLVMVQPPGTTGAVNVKEVWAFNVVVTNKGNLNMKNVTLRYTGLNSAAVGATAAAAATAPSGNHLTTAVIPNVPAHSSIITSNYFFRAPNAPTTAAVDLVEVHLEGWDADLNHLLTNLSGQAVTPSKRYNAQVFP